MAHGLPILTHGVPLFGFRRRGHDHEALPVVGENEGDRVLL